MNTLQQNFTRHLATLFQNPHPDQQKAWDRFQSIGLPKKNFEIYKHVRLNKLYPLLLPYLAPIPQPEINTNHLPEGSYQLVMINGHFQPTLSHLPKSLTVLPLAEAKRKFAGFFKQRLQTWIKEEQDPFALLNGALGNEGLFLYLPPNITIEEPIHHISVTQGSGTLFPKIYLGLGKGAQLTLYTSQQPSPEPTWTNTLFDFSLDENAHLTHHTLSDESPHGSNFQFTRATLKRDSHLKTLLVTNGGALARYDYHISLLGEQCEASLNGVWSLKDRHQAHINVHMHHRAPNTTSEQNFKGILDDASLSSFEGKIIVDQIAQKTEAYQRNANLLLTSKASAHTRPNLEIHADDVKASHGATTGQLNEEHLFYLTTRGIPKPTAHRLLMQGFCHDILKHLAPAAQQEARRLCQL